MTVQTPELPALESDLFVNFDGDLEFDVDVTYDIEEIMPSGINTQRVSLLLHVEDFGYIYPREIISFDFYRDIQEGARLSVSFRGDRPKIMTELNWRTAPPGKKKIQVWTGYLTSNGMLWKKLMTDGISDGSDRSIQRDGAIMSIEVLDKKHRYKCEKVDYNVPPNSNKRVTDIIKELAELIGVDNVSIPSFYGQDFKTNKEITLVCEEAWPKMEECADAIGAKINFNEEGRLELYDVSNYSTSQYQMVIKDFNIISNGGFKISFPGGDIATKIIVEGELVSTDECGIVTVRTSKKYYGPREKAFSFWVQSSVDGSLSTTGLTNEIIPEDLISEIITIVTLECGTVIEELVITKGWKNKEIWRYGQDASGVTNSYNGCYVFDPSATADDSTKSYEWLTDKYVIISKVNTRYLYSNIGYFREGLDGFTYNIPSRMMPGNYISINNITDSVLYRTVVSTEGWHIPKRAIQTGDGSYISGVKKTGDGVGVGSLTNTGYEAFYGNANENQDDSNILSAVDTFVYNKLERVKFKEIAVEHAFLIPPGSLYIFAGNQFSSEQFERTVVNIPPFESFAVNMSLDPSVNGVSIEPYYDYGFPHNARISGPSMVAITVTEYIASGGSLTTVIARTDERELGSPVTTEVLNGPGYLPASTFKEKDDTNADVNKYYVEVFSGLLEENRIHCAREMYHELIDNEEWARWWAEYKLREGSALRIALSMPMANYIMPNMKVRVNSKYGSCFETAMVTNHSISKGSRTDPMLSNISGVIYVV